MARSNNTDQSTDVRSVLLEELRTEQKEYGEYTIHWALLQDKINQIIAQNYLHYVNR
jgi:hypothetical protein